MPGAAVGKAMARTASDHIMRSANGRNIIAISWSKVVLLNDACATNVTEVANVSVVRVVPPKPTRQLVALNMRQILINESR